VDRLQQTAITFVSQIATRHHKQTQARSSHKASATCTVSAARNMRPRHHADNQVLVWSAFCLSACGRGRGPSCRANTPAGGHDARPRTPHASLRHRERAGIVRCVDTWCGAQDGVIPARVEEGGLQRGAGPRVAAGHGGGKGTGRHHSALIRWSILRPAARAGLLEAYLHALLTLTLPPLAPVQAGDVNGAVERLLAIEKRTRLVRVLAHLTMPPGAQGTRGCHSVAGRFGASWWTFGG
jgi:hypothetical protein